MSYELTDAGEEAMAAEVRVLENLNDEIDQLASTARDCMTVAPDTVKALDFAWYCAEAEAREIGPGYSSCGHVRPVLGSGNFCQCCHAFEERKAKYERLRRML